MNSPNYCLRLGWSLSLHPGILSTFDSPDFGEKNLQPKMKTLQQSPRKMLQGLWVMRRSRLSQLQIKAFTVEFEWCYLCFQARGCSTINKKSLISCNHEASPGFHRPSSRKQAIDLGLYVSDICSNSPGKIATFRTVARE